MYSFNGLGSVNLANIPLSMGQSYPAGDTRNLDVYDDAILRRARTTTKAKSAPSSIYGNREVQPTRLSFGSAVGSTGIAPSTPLSFGSKVQGGTNALTSFFQNFTLGTPVNAGSGGGMSIPTGVSPIPQVVTADGDGSSGALSGLKDLAKGIIANMGSSGDGDVVPVSYQPTAQPSGGFNPLWIAAAAVAAGAIYYAAAK